MKTKLKAMKFQNTKYFLTLIFILTIIPKTTLLAQWTIIQGVPAGEFSSIYENNETLYAGSGNVLYFSTDAGYTWTEPGIIKEEVDFISSILKVNNIIFVGTYSYGIFKSSDNGVSWLPFNSGLSSILDISNLVQRGDSIYAGTIGNSIFTSKIDGNLWSSFNEGIPLNIAGTVYSLYNFKGRLITGSGMNAYIYYNDNGTYTWTGIPFTLFVPQGAAMLAFINKESTLYGIGSQGIYKSIDNGLNWEYFNPGIGDIEIGAFYIFEETIFAMLTKSNRTYYFTCNNNSNQWSTFDYQQGATTYGFIIYDSKIFAARLDGLYYRDLSSTSTKDQIIPNKFTLFQNYPNPFIPNTNIKFSIPKPDIVQINVYNILGNHIITLTDEYKQAGTYEVEFNANNFPSGVYFYKMVSGNFRETKKIILLR